MAKSKSKSTPAPKAVTEMLVIASRVKEVVKSLGMRSDADFVDALSAKVHEKIIKAAQRAQAHGVSTVRARDL